MDTTIQIRTKTILKNKALKVFKRQGVSMSLAFNTFLEEVAIKGSLPVQVYPVAHVPAPVSRNWKQDMEKDIKTGKKYKSVEGMWRDSKNW